MKQLKFKLYKGGHKPEQKTLGAAAFDINTDCPEEMEYYTNGDFLFSIFPGINIIPFQIAFEIPEGYYLRLDPRSSTFTDYGFICPSSIIDEDYRGIVHGLIYNTTNKTEQFKSIRMFQITLNKKEHCFCKQVDELSETKRGAKGLGSTGK